ncbi:MAG: polysaccharide deacetylase family protein [Akkermansiaceae bacterium]|nr:polysaccharide deacetylase family protein [Akkermansiaceae bacterium]
MNKHWMILLSVALGSGLAVAAPGDTKVAKWKDDRTAAFLLMFDDGWPSHWQVAIPEMAKRGLIGTFYINPEKGEYKKFEEKWTKEIPGTGMVYGNHTMTHQGVRDAEHAEYEVGACAEYIRKVTAKEKPELLSYGQPGVGPGKWNITKEQLDELLEKHHLIDRPPFRDHGAVYHLQTTEQMMALADKAVGEKGMEYLVLHGVERKEPDWGYQDFWALKQDVFFPLLDRLKEKSDKGELWITDHVTQHKYEVQREAAAVKVVRAAAEEIELEVTCSADPKWYDGVLTFITEVPGDWKKVAVSQGDARATVDVKDGVVKFDALPGAVVLTAQ